VAVIGATTSEVSGGKTVYRLDSRKSLELNIADLIIDGKLDIYPHVEDRGLLFVQFRRSKLVLSAGPFIGLIPLTPLVSVEVRPKLDVSNLARVLDAARGSLSTISGVDRLYLANELASNSVLEFLAANLLDALHPIQVNGLLKEYVRHSEITSMPSGRIEIAGTMREWARGQRHKVRAQRFEQSSNVSPNRLIKAALRSILTRLRMPTEQGRLLISKVNRAYFDLPAAVSEMTPRDFDTCRRMLADNQLPASRAYYTRALEIALLIMSNRGISLQDQGRDVLLETFIVNFEILFEEYLRRSLQQRAGDGLRVRDGNKEGKKALFDDVRDPPAQPDIVISSVATGKKVIAEVKYKERPNRDDINQAITYAVSYRTDHAVLVHQCPTNAAGGLSHIGTVNGIRLDAYAFDLSNADLIAEENAFAAGLLALVGP